MNQEINFELKNIVHWLRANKISLNTKKTEIVLFRAQKTIITKNMNFRISGQKVNIMKETKYLGMIMAEHLTFKNRMDTVKLKLNRANGLLFRTLHYLKQYTIPFVNPTCNMDVNYGGKHKRKSYRILRFG